MQEEHEVKIYLTTYEYHNNIQWLLDNLKPCKILVLKKNQESNNPTKEQNNTRYEAVKLIQDEELDFCILTRYDLHYFDNINNCNLNYDKINFLCKEGSWYETHGFVSDLFFAWNSCFTKNIIDALKVSRKNTEYGTHMIMNHLKTSIKDDGSFHFMNQIPHLGGAWFASMCRGEPGMTEQEKIHYNIHPEVYERFKKID